MPRLQCVLCAFRLPVYHQDSSMGCCQLDTLCLTVVAVVMLMVAVVQWSFIGLVSRANSRWQNVVLFTGKLIILQCNCKTELTNIATEYFFVSLMFNILHETGSAQDDVVSLGTHRNQLDPA